MSSKPYSEGNKQAATPRVKLVIQQCLSAELALPTGSTAAISRGIVVFVCFLRGASRDDAVRAAETACAVRLSETEGEGEKRVSVADLAGGQVLVVPQATLGGKLKGSRTSPVTQYHGNVAKDEGEALYVAFYDKICEVLGEPDPGTTSRVKRGIYGARQVLSSTTNGPYTHVFEI